MARLLLYRCQSAARKRSALRSHDNCFQTLAECATTKMRSAIKK